MRVRAQPPRSGLTASAKFDSDSWSLSSRSMSKSCDDAKGDAQSTGRLTSRNATRSSTECVCDCGDPQEPLISLHDFRDWATGYVLCDCTFCGPTLGDGSQRCTIEVDPIVAVLFPQVTSRGGRYVPVLLCEDCRGHNIQLMRPRKRVKYTDHRGAEGGGRAASASTG